MTTKAQADTATFRGSWMRAGAWVNILVCPLFAATIVLISPSWPGVLASAFPVKWLVDSVLLIKRAEIAVRGSRLTVANIYRAYEFDVEEVTIYVGRATFSPSYAVVVIGSDGHYAVSRGVDGSHPIFEELEAHLFALGAGFSTNRLSWWDQLDLGIWSGSRERRIR